MSRYRVMANAVIREPAEDPLEEVYRAVTEVWGSVGLLVKCGDDYWQVVTNRLGNVPLSEWGDLEIPDKATRLQDVRDRVKGSFKWFHGACPRAAAAIVRIDWGPLGTSPNAALAAIAELRRLFPQPFWQPPGDLPGHHLLMDGSILGMSSRRSSGLEQHRVEINELRLTLERFAGSVTVFLDAGVKLKLNPGMEGPHPNPDEETCWTKTTLASVVGVVPSTLWRWTSALETCISAKGKGDLLTRGDLEAIANARFEAGNRIQGERIRFAART